MADIQKPLGMNNIWAENGLKAPADPSKIDQGWVVEKPPYQTQNWLDNKQDTFQAHVNQHGIPYKDDETEYQAGKSYVVDPISGIVYKCIVTHVNQPVTNPVYWDVAFSPYEAMVPAGFTGHHAGFTPPRGWLVADGRAVPRTQYPALFAAIGVAYGSGDGTTTFNLPDLRGVVSRGLDSGRNLDPSRVQGTYQGDLFASHTHSATSNVQSAGTHQHNVTGTADPSGNHQHSLSASTDMSGEHTHSYSSTTAFVTQVQGEGGYTLYHPITQQTVASGLHQHSVTGTAVSAGQHSHSVTGTAVSAGQHSHTATVTVQSTGGAETRMKNIALLGIIKY